MADASLTLAAVGTPDVDGSKRVWFADVTFTGNYRTGGVALTAAAAAPICPNLTVIEHVQVLGGVAPAADQATANPIAWNPATGKFVLFEGSAAGTALSEKTDNEVVATGQVFRVKITGH